MNLTKWLLTAGCAVALGVPHAWPQPPAPQNPPVPRDVSKYVVVERPTSQLIANSAPAAPTIPAAPAVSVAPAVPAVVLDVGKKKRVEPAVSKLVAGSAPATPAPANHDPSNPTVEPGKVKWHKTLADAQAAAEKSGKPVLLFHMMGQLDKQFC